MIASPPLYETPKTLWVGGLGFRADYVGQIIIEGLLAL